MFHTNMNGHYDDNGHWQRDKFCFVYCGERCDCGAPGGRIYAPEHDKRLTAPPTPPRVCATCVFLDISPYSQPCRDCCLNQVLQKGGPDKWKESNRDE